MAADLITFADQFARSDSKHDVVVFPDQLRSLEERIDALSKTLEENTVSGIGGTIRWVGFVKPGYCVRIIKVKA